MFVKFDLKIDELFCKYWSGADRKRIARQLSLPRGIWAPTLQGKPLCVFCLLDENPDRSDDVQQKVAWQCGQQMSDWISFSQSPEPVVSLKFSQDSHKLLQDSWLIFTTYVVAVVSGVSGISSHQQRELTIWAAKWSRKWFFFQVMSLGSNASIRHSSNLIGLWGFNANICTFVQKSVSGCVQIFEPVSVHL